MAVRRPRKPGPRPRAEYLITTHPVATTCSCGAKTLSCYVDGEPTRIDPWALSARAEAMALVMGSVTYAILGYGRSRPVRRRRWHIRGGLPERGRVHAGHRCGMSWADPSHRDDRRFFDDQYHGHQPPF